MSGTSGTTCSPASTTSSSNSSFPLLGGIGLWIVFFITLRDSASPDYDGTGVSIFGLGVVFVLGLGLILAGVVLMFVWRFKAPAFFRGETLNKGTPSLIIPE